MLRILRVLAVMVTLLWAGGMSGQSAKGVKTPDFAYPRTVSAQARESLTKALADGDDKAVVRSLLDYTLAQSAIAATNLPGSLTLIDSVKTASDNRVLKGMLSTLEAVVYDNVYSSARWKYDRRTSPMMPLPADYTEWTGEQFRYKIVQLLDEALADSVALRAVPIGQYKNVVEQEHWTSVYFPTLYSFVTARAIDIISGWGNENSERVIALYDSVINESQRGSAPWVNACIGRLEYNERRIPQARVYSSAGYLQSSFLRLYRSCLTTEGKPVTEYAGDILLEMPTYDKTYRRELYDYITSFVKAYPGYWRKDCLLQRLNQLEQKDVLLTSPCVTGPGREVEFVLEMDNVERLTLDIYDVSSARKDIDDFTFTSGMSGARRVASLPVVVSGERVPFVTERRVTYRFDRPGNYIAVPVVAGKVMRKESFQKIHVTSVALFATSLYDCTIWAVDANTGAPLHDVMLSINSEPYRAGSTAVKIGKTDAEGALVHSGGNGTVIAVREDDSYAMPLRVYGCNYERPDKWSMAANGYSSLPLYHQGDTAEWVAVCYEYKGGLRRPYGGRQVKAVLYDANSMPVDTLEVTTDKFGRATGAFVLPTDGLTGSFNIAVDGQWNVVRFEVSDYKLPTFKVFTPKVEQDTPAKGDVTVRGKVETYAGFALADAEVTLSLSVMQQPRWWYPTQSYDVYSTVTHTDAQGCYEVMLPADIFASSPIPEGYYTASVSVLSPAGETQTGSVSFARAERYIIKATMPSEYDLTKGRMPLEVRVVNYEDSVVNRPVTMTLTRDDSVVVAARSVSGRDDMHVSALAQGKYQVSFACEDADTVRSELILYNPSATESPVGDMLIWSPDGSMKVDGIAGNGSWLYAASCDTHVLATVWTPDSVLSRRWIDARKGFNRLDVSLPAGVDKATLMVIATGGYKSKSQNVAVERAGSEIGLKIIAESFRDRTVPGSEETWTFRIVDTKGNGREAAVIADMYNTALDAIAMSDWNMYLRSGNERWMHSSMSNLSGSSRFYLSLPVKVDRRLKCPSFYTPYFNTYGRSFRSYFGRGLRVRNELMSKAAKVDGLANVETEEVMSDMVLSEPVADMGAAPMLTGAVASYVSEHKSAVDVEEAAEEDGEAASAQPKTAEFAYRDSNVPLAFFRPSLVTGNDGRLELKFTVPNANTTWGFRALAFTDSLLSATLSRNVIASKDIMVQPNLPRFLRTGDVAVIKASVMNATDTAQYVTTDIEIFNPSDGKSIITLHKPDTIAPRGNVVVETSLTVPSGMAMVGYRVKSSTSSFADGEQAMIPVLPASTPVIETIPFYLGPTQHELKTRMPEMPKDGRVTLQFCENPTWYVVTALPGLLKNESSTAPDAARAIFSASIASGLLRDNPAIAEALREWSEGDGSSEMLTSMLERNEELKIVLLNATPWMLDARNDTERMTRLSLLFDKKTIDKTLNDNIALLEKLSCKGGGWSWCTAYPEASQWATRSVLAHLGRLVQLGFLPDNGKLKSMLTAALKWDTAETLKDFRKYPDSDYTSYVYLHDMFARGGYGAADSRIVNSVTQYILSHWRDESLARKAVDAQVLYRHDYRSMAGEILASIRQYGESTTEWGMSFPSLDDSWYGTMDKVGITALILETFHMVEPGCAEVDLLRQWLILQKGAQNWGSSSTASDVVAAILVTSDRWISAAEGAELKIGGKRLEPEKYERLTGEFEVTLPAKDVSKKELTVKKSADTPAWGAVYCQYVDNMTAVKAVSCPELSVEKSMPDSMSVGERVTVRLTLKVHADMDYVAIIDDRPACLEPVEQLPTPIYAEGLCFYRENRDSSTRIFIDRLPKGTYVLSYDMWVNNAGTYTSGIATVQSEYAPRYSAHSAGKTVVAAE